MDTDAEKSSKIDPQLAHFLELESQRAKFQQVVHSLSDQCWDVCLGDRMPGAKLEAKQQSCVENCVNRFIDASHFILQRLQEKQAAQLGK